MEQPPRYPHLGPNDLCLFPKIKSALKGRRFQDIEDIKKVMVAPKAVPQQVFQKRFRQWQHHWVTCIGREG